MADLAHKIGILTDTHGNIYALESILSEFARQKVDEIIHCGDVVNMAPYSKECLELLLAQKNCTLLLGNHDFDYLNDRRQHLPLSHVSGEHKAFVFDSLGEELKKEVAKFPKIVFRKHGNTTFAFCHYALLDNPTNCGYIFKPLVAKPTTEIFDDLFAEIDADVIFFGHKHESCHLVGQKTYIDVGSVGCHESLDARGIVLELFEDGTYSCQQISVPYNREKLKQEMSGVPDGDYIFDFYFDRNFGTLGEK